MSLLVLCKKYTYVAFDGYILVISTVIIFVLRYNRNIYLNFRSTGWKKFFIPITLKIEGYWILFMQSVLLILSHCHMQKGLMMPQWSLGKS